MKLKSKYYSPFLILFLLSFCAFGQHPSEQGQFEVDYIKGCAPLTIQATSTPDPPPGPNESVQYDYDYDPNEGFENTSATTYTYDEPGIYTIVQIIGTSGTRRDLINIEVMEPREVDFTVYNCGNNAVAVEINDTYYDSYTIDYGDGSPLTSDVTHTYSGSGTYPVTVTGRFTNTPNNCEWTTKQITPASTLAQPEISTVEVLDIDPENGSVRLTYSLNPHTKYALEMLTNNTGSAEIMQVDDLENMTISNLNTRDNYYCFTLYAVNPCDNSRQPSGTVCSIRLNATAENRENVLSWSSVADNYEIIRDGQTLVSPAPQAQDYADGNVVCNQQYCYQVVGNTGVNGNLSKSISGTVCLTAVSDEIPPAIDNVTASVEGQNIQLTWEEPLGFNVRQYIVTRTEDDSNYTVIDTITDNSYSDTGLNTGGRKYCYKINYVDECGKASHEGSAACPMLLQGTQLNPNEAEIFWSEYTGWKNPPAEYILELLSEDGQVLESIPAGRNTSHTVTFDEQIQVSLYRVSAISSDMPPRISYSNTLRYVVPSQVFLPEAFTPNNDGLNDVYKAEGKYIHQFSLLIFNRWGELVYKADNAGTGWDGTINGKEAPQGTYVYKYKMEDHSGQIFEQSGSFILLR